MPVDSGVLLNGTLTRNASNPIIPDGNHNTTTNWPAAAVSSFDSVKAGPRSIIKVGATDYRCWYEGVSASTDGSSQQLTSVCYATSTDGTTWAKYSGNPVITPSPTGTAPTWEHNEFSVGTVLWDPDAGLFKLWGHGGNNSGPRQIGYATSADGITWTKSASNPIIANGAASTWNEGLVADITVLRLGPTDYRAWLKGATNASAVSYGYYTSSDGVAWTPYASNPVIPSTFIAAQTLASSHVVLINGAFHMWIASAANGLYYTSSTDGINWATPSQVLANGVDSPTDTIFAYVDGTSVRVQYGYDNPTPSPAIRDIREATTTTPSVAAQNPLTGVGIWPNRTVGVSAWASLTDGSSGLSGQITTDRYNGHAATIKLTAQTGAAAPASNRHWEVWLCGSTDGGTNGGPTFSSTAGVFLGVIPAPTAINTAATAIFDTASVLALLPETWCIKLVNRTGQTMAASGHACSVLMQRAG